MATGKKPEEHASHTKDADGVSDLDDAALNKRRAELDAKLATVTRDRKESQRGLNRTGSLQGASYAFKLSSEFIAAILVGAVMGWMIDAVVGTKPWGLVIFLLLGFVAGVLNVLRSAGKIAPSKTERGFDLKPEAKKNETPPGNAWPDEEED